MLRVVGCLIDSLLIGAFVAAFDWLLYQDSLGGALFIGSNVGVLLALSFAVLRDDLETPGLRIAKRFISGPGGASRTRLSGQPRQTAMMLVLAFAIAIFSVMVYWGVAGAISAARDREWFGMALEVGVATLFLSLLAGLVRREFVRRP